MRCYLPLPNATSLWPSTVGSRTALPRARLTHGPERPAGWPPEEQGAWRTVASVAQLPQHAAGRREKKVARRASRPPYCGPYVNCARSALPAAQRAVRARAAPNPRPRAAAAAAAGWPPQAGAAAAVVPAARPRSGSGRASQRTLESSAELATGASGSRCVASAAAGSSGASPGTASVGARRMVWRRASATGGAVPRRPDGRAGAAQQDGGSSDAGACKRIMQASSAKQGWQSRDHYKFGGVWGGQERGSRARVFILWPPEPSPWPLTTRISPSKRK